MADRRWQPPPLAPDSGQGEPKVTVDEKVVRKMLKVNPDLRKGRTTAQVKRALESGEAVGGAPEAKAASAAPQGQSELEDTLGFFLRGKADKLRDDLAAIEHKRRALAEEEARLKAQLREQLAGFLSLLDAKAVDAKGAAALAKHAELLKVVGLTPQQLLEAARRGRR